MKKGLSISAIDQKDVQSGLEVLEGRDVVLEREKCFICGEKVDEANLGGFFPVREQEVNKVKVFCDKTSCSIKAFKKRRDINGNGSLNMP